MKTGGLILAVLAILIVSVPTLNAGGCYGRNRYAVSYAPTYYTPAYQPYVEKVPFFYSVSDYWNAQVNLALIDVIKAQRAGTVLQSVERGPSPAAAAVPSAQQPPPPVLMQRAGGPALFQNEKLLAVVNASCAKCHGPQKQDGGLALVTADGKLADLPEGVLWKSHSMVVSGEMPKAGPQVADADLSLFYSWAKAARK